MAGTWRGMAMAVGLSFWPGPGQTQTPAPPPGAPDGCEWRAPADGAAAALMCRQADASWAAAGVSGFGPDTWSMAQAGDATAMRTLGRFYVYGPAAQRDAQRALGLLEAAAGKGDVRAMLDLAVIYRDGVGVPKDFAQSTQWYRAAADKGDPEGMFALAAAYASASGVVQDDVAAVEWFRAATDKGFAAAMAQLGVMYFVGRGVARDYVQAASWFQKAAEAGSPEGMQYLAYVYDKGLGVPASRENSQTWRVAAAASIRWDVLPTDQEKQDVFPVEAAVASVSGVAYLDCRVAEDRSPEDCHVIGESPASMGFGEAGLRLVPKMRLAAGLPVGAEFRLPVRFALPTGIFSGRAHADECAAEGLALRKLQPLSADADWWARYWAALSAYDAARAGQADSPDRLAAQTAAASDRLAQGKDRGFFGLTSRCLLR